MLNKLSWFFRGIGYQIYQLKLPKFLLIGKPIFLKGLNSISFGDKLRIFPGARIECSNGGKVVFGKNTTIGHNLHLTSIKDDLIIGNNCILSSNVLITNNDHEYRDVKNIIQNQPIIHKSTIIGNNCFLGSGSVILPGSSLGNHSIVGANSVVRGNFPSYVVIAGNPAKVIKIYDVSIKKWITPVDENDKK